MSMEFDVICTAAAVAGVLRMCERARKGPLQPPGLYFLPCAEAVHRDLRLLPADVAPPSGYRRADAGPGLTPAVPFSSYMPWVCKIAAQLPVFAPHPALGEPWPWAR